METILVSGLTKLYGRERGVSELCFSVGEGEVFGYLGPNGAGKTTTIRLLLDLIRPTSGAVELFGRDLSKGAVELKRRIGYIPGDLRLYEQLTGRQLLAYFARLRALDLRGADDRLAQRLDLDLDRPIHTLSRGNRQKIGLIQAFAHRPELLVLDEPTSGLDPLMQQEFNALVREAAADGRTVFLSSHVLSEVQQMADRVALLREGELVLLDTVEGLRARATARMEVTFAAEPAADAFTRVPGVRELDRRGPTVSFALEGSADPLVKAIANHEVLAIDSHEADLEDVFLALYRREPGDAG